MNKQIIATNLKNVRAALKWSQDTAARQLGIRRSTLASYEEARALPSVILLPKIADVYGIIDWKGFILDAEFNFNNQKNVTYTISLIEQNFNALNGKEKSLAKTLLNLPEIF